MGFMVIYVEMPGCIMKGIAICLLQVFPRSWRKQSLLLSNARLNCLFVRENLLPFPFFTLSFVQPFFVNGPFNLQFCWHLQRVVAHGRASKWFIRIISAIMKNFYKYKYSVFSIN